MTVVVGTAGHIDHGKTTLLRALTGIDADRLPEERRRGMTIDVGYAHMALGDGSQLDFVDVPGHDKLVGNMLVGAGEIDAALLVVAADDGPRAQTLEHLELLDALAVSDAIAVVTKIDAIDAARTREVVAATQALLERTVLAGAPVVAVSAVSGLGLDELRAALQQLVERVRERGLSGGPPRLAIDRVFSVKGRGAVVTGTLRGGPLERGMIVRAVPSGHEARIREVQVHGATVERAAGGGRTALNLGGVDSADLRRGAILVADVPAGTDGTPIGSDRVLVALRPVAVLGAAAPLLPADRARVRIHAGTEAAGAVVGRGAREAAELPNGEVAAILRLDKPVALAFGDRFVLRRSSPAATLAGGRVLDANPPRGLSRRRATPGRIGALAAATAPAEQRAARLDLHGAIAGHPVALAADVAEAMEDDILAIATAREGWIPVADIRAAAAAALRRRVTIDEANARAAASAILDGLAGSGRLTRDGDRVARPGTATAGLAPAVLQAMDTLETALDTPAPPRLPDAARQAGCPPDGVRALEAAGRIVRLDDDLAWSAGAYRRLETLALELAATRPLTPAALRDASGTSRKYVMAILEDLGRRAVLSRTPDGHVPGPKAAVSSRS